MLFVGTLLLLACREAYQFAVTISADERELHKFLGLQPGRCWQNGVITHLLRAVVSDVQTCLVLVCHLLELLLL